MSEGSATPVEQSEDHTRLAYLSWQLSSPEELYELIVDGDDSAPQALLSLELRSWITQIIDVDPVTGEAQSSGLIELLGRIADSQSDVIFDLPYYISSRIEKSVGELQRALRSMIQREYQLQPIYSVREVDFNTTLWLSRKPGRNVREKLSGKPYLNAVKRRASFDTSENRLLKAFIERFTRLLEVREESLKPRCDDLSIETCYQLRQLMRSEAFEEIRPWGNLPPNNTLLSHRSYRKIWDAWLLVQALSEHMSLDLKSRGVNLIKIVFWELLTHLSTYTQAIVPQQPIQIKFFKLDLQTVKAIQGLWSSDQGVQDWALDLKLDSRQISLRFDKLLIKLLFKEDEVEITLKQKMWSLRTDKLSVIHEIKELVYTQILGLRALSKPQQTTNIQTEVQAHSGTIDLLFTRPKLSSLMTPQSQLPALKPLILQLWCIDNQHEEINCADARALYLGAEITTLTIRRLISHTLELTAAQKNSALMSLMRLLKASAPLDQLTYLVPDAISEFELQALRRSINFHFPSSRPLPRSIAAVFSFLHAQKAEVQKIKEHDVIVAVDFTQNSITLTPLLVTHHQELKKENPESLGVSWERHPTVKHKVDQQVDDYIKTLKSHYGDHGEELYEIYGSEELVDSTLIHSIYDETWVHIDHAPPLKIELKDELILDAVSSISKSKNSRIWVLTLSTCVHVKNSKFHQVKAHQFDLTHGSEYLSQLANRTPDIPLWRDHLPPLWIKASRLHEPLALVQGITVEPTFGRSNHIHIPTRFALPKGKKQIKFSLIQGQGKSELDYFATLKSPLFPLDEDLECSLKMTYTYGADEPYKLEFIPVVPTAGIKSLLVKWTPKDGEEESIDLDALPMPPLPEPHTFESLTAFPNKKNKDQFFNIFSKINELFDLYAQLEEHLLNPPQVIQPNYSTGELIFYKSDRNGNLFCKVDYDGEEIVCFERNFLKAVQYDDLWIGMDVYFTQQNDQVYDVTFGDPCDELRIKSTQEYLLERHRKRAKFIIDKIKKGKGFWRFLFYTLWSNGRSLSYSDVPESFRTKALDFIQRSTRLLQGDMIHQAHKDELVFLISIIHQDLTLEHIQAIEQLPEQSYHSDTGSYFIYQRVAYAIGTGQLPWQRSLLNRALSPHHLSGKMIQSEWVTRMLYIILWRGQRLCAELTPETLGMIMDYLTLRLQYLCKRNKKTANKKTAKFFFYNFEVTLGALLSRHNTSHAMKEVLAPNAPRVLQYLEALQQAEELIGQDKSQQHFKSRIELELDKPDGFQNTPDLIYALKLYLTGDTGAGSIKILNVDDD